MTEGGSLFHFSHPAQHYASTNDVAGLRALLMQGGWPETLTKKSSPLFKAMLYAQVDALKVLLETATNEDIEYSWQWLKVNRWGWGHDYCFYDGVWAELFLERLFRSGEPLKGALDKYQKKVSERIVHEQRFLQALSAPGTAQERIVGARAVADRTLNHELLNALQEARFK